MQSTWQFQPIEAFLTSLVHPSAAAQATAAARHRAFIAGHLGSALLALATLPIYLAFASPSPWQLLAFAWLMAPLGVALYLSCTGHQARAHLMSALSFAGFVVSLAASTGGLNSYALVWLVAVPLGAALSGSRRVIAQAGAVALAALATLVAADLAGLLPPVPDPGWSGRMLAGLIVVAAIAYAASLSFAIERLGSASEAAMRNGDERYRLLADNVSDLITRHLPNGGVAFASPAAQRLLRVAPVDLLGNGLFERVHITDRPAYLRVFAEANAARRPTSAEFRVRSEGDAVHMWVETRCRPVVSGDGTVESIIAVTRDISERKRYEAELLAAREEAERSSSAKSCFLASMSHELRTPLNAVIGFSEILAGEMINGLDAARRREYARLIHDSGTHLLQVVNEVLDVSRIEAGTFRIFPEPFDLAALVEGCCRMMQCEAARNGLSLVVEMEDDLPETQADKRACRQILLNLLSNAIKFTPAGGRIVVALSRAGSQVHLSVADTGIGIPARDLPRLGMPFVQLDSAYDSRREGAGLGLSIVKGLVALHHGGFTIASEAGCGTTVAVTFPLASERTESRHLEHVAARAARRA